jgi:hypothetical protein
MLIDLQDAPEHLRPELARYGKAGEYAPIAPTRNAAKVAKLDRLVNDLWDFRQSQKRAITANITAFHESLKAMPWWARPGYDTCDDQGNLCGNIVALPARQSFARMPMSGCVYRIRESEYDLERVGSWWSEGAKAKWLERLAALKEAADAERKKAGATAAYRVVSRDADLTRAIRNTFVRMAGVSPAALAALTLYGINEDYRGKEYSQTLPWDVVATLRLTLPATNGSLRRAAEDCIAHRSRAGKHRTWMLPAAQWCPNEADRIAETRLPKSAIKPQPAAVTVADAPATFVAA